MNSAIVATRLLIAGNDKIGRRLLAQVGAIDNLLLAADGTTDWRRVLRLVRRRRLPISWLITMVWAEWRRPAVPAAPVAVIRTNRDLMALIERGVRQVYLFRAGLIVDRAVLASGVEILNVHCASLSYGGIGGIIRALRDRSLRQSATLHRVTERIDAGEVVDAEPYDLEPSVSYRVNEDAAYAAGQRLLLGALAGTRAASGRSHTA